MSYRSRTLKIKWPFLLLSANFGKGSVWSAWIYLLLNRVHDQKVLSLTAIAICIFWQDRKHSESICGISDNMWTLCVAYPQWFFEPTHLEVILHGTVCWLNKQPTTHISGGVLLTGKIYVSAYFCAFLCEINVDNWEEKKQKVVLLKHTPASKQSLGKAFTHSKISNVCHPLNLNFKFTWIYWLLL